MEKQKLKSIYLLITFSILLFFCVQNLALVASFIGFIYSALKPLIYGGIIAFIVNIPMSGIEKLLSKKMKKGQRAVAYLITIFIFLVFLAALIAVIIPQIVISLTQIIHSIENLYNQLPRMYEELSASIPMLNEYIGDINWTDILADATVMIESIIFSLVEGLTGFIGGVFGSVVNFVVAFIFSIYLLFSKEKVYIAIKNLFYSAFKKEKMDKVYKVADLTNKSFYNFIQGQATESIIIGVIFLVVLSVLGFNYAVLISTIMSVGSLIPIFGSAIGCVIAMFFLATVNLNQAIWFLILFIVIQQVEGNLIYPYVVGNKVGIPAILVFMSVVLGGNLLGLVGMLTFIPISGVIYTLLKEFVENKKINLELNEEQLEKIE